MEKDKRSSVIEFNKAGSIADSLMCRSIPHDCVARRLNSLAIRPPSLAYERLDTSSGKCSIIANLRERYFSFVIPAKAGIQRGISEQTGSGLYFGKQTKWYPHRDFRPHKEDMGAQKQYGGGLLPNVRNVDEITSTTMHHSIRPSLPDLKSKNS